jgi:murein DD-endopeptidase MepM/ murein hydrolase activator NlpD
MSPIKKGQWITQQTEIMKNGQSGNASGRVDHCHFEVKIKGTLVNPLSIMGKIVGSLTQQSPTKQSISSIINFWNSLIKEF